MEKGASTLVYFICFRKGLVWWRSEPGQLSLSNGITAGSTMNTTNSCLVLTLSWIGLDLEVSQLNANAI
jgi:hypothetical protein